MKKAILTIVLFASFFAFSQNLNSYKYALLPSKFSFQKETDQYNVNTIVRMILEKNQFETYRDDEKLPEEFAVENCNKVYTDLNVINSIFVTKVKIILKDCKNNVLFTSKEGKSNEKDNVKAFTEALREASQSLEVLNHKYQPVQNLIKDEKLADNYIINKTSINSNQLTASPTLQGWNLINSNNKIEIILFKTTLNDFYIAKKQDKQGIIYKKNDFWFFEYYDKVLEREQLTIQF